MRQTTQSLKELYEKDFYLWVQENLKLHGAEKLTSSWKLFGHGGGYAVWENERWV
jgi:hypothetical protein